MATANPYANYQNSYFDVEKGHDEVVERTLRQGFVKKVFGKHAPEGPRPQSQSPGPVALHTASE